MCEREREGEREGGEREREEEGERERERERKKEREREREREREGCRAWSLRGHTAAVQYERSNNVISAARCRLHSCGVSPLPETVAL